MTIAQLNDLCFMLAWILSLGGLSVVAIIYGVRWVRRWNRLCDDVDRVWASLRDKREKPR